MADSQSRRWSDTGNLIRLGLGMIVAVTAVALLLRSLEWQEVVSALRSADYRWLPLAALGIVGTFFTRTRRWQALLYRADIGLLPAMTALLVGQVVNMALPLMRSGDLARAFWTNQREATGVSEGLGSIALEKVWDLLALCACGVILLLTVPLPGWFAQSTWGTLVVVTLGITVLLLGLHWQRPLMRWATRALAWLPARWGKLLTPQLSQLVQALDAIRDRNASVNAGLWTAATWALGGLANWAVMRAFGIEGVLAAIFLLAALMLGGAVVPTPAGLGIYEGIVVVSLGLFDVEPSLAMAVGLVLHVMVVGPPLVTAALLAMTSALRSAPERV